MGIFDFASVKRSVQSMEERLSALREEIEVLRRERVLIDSAPVAKEDVKAVVSKWIRDSGEAYTSHLKAAVADMARTPTAFSNQGRLKQLAGLGAQGLQNGGEVDSQAIGQALCAVFGTTVNQAIGQVIDAMEWPSNALTSQKRNSALESINERIFKLEGEAEELINKASELGIRLG